MYMCVCFMCAYAGGRKFVACYCYLYEEQSQILFIRTILFSLKIKLPISCSKATNLNFISFNISYRYLMSTEKARSRSLGIRQAASFSAVVLQQGNEKILEVEKNVIQVNKSVKAYFTTTEAGPRLWCNLSWSCMYARPLIAP